MNETQTDPLDMNVEDVDLSYPIIPAGIHEFKITKAEVKPNAEGSGNNLVLTLQATSDKQSIKGETVHNFTLTTVISLTETEKWLAVDIGRRIATVCQAAELRGVSPRQIITEPNRLVNRVVQVKTQVSQERTDKKTGRIYEPRTEVASFVIKK